MSDTRIRTPAEALEAAAQVARSRVYRDSAGTGFDEDGFEADIRALASRILPAPDDAALVEMVAQLLAIEECEAHINTRTRIWGDMPEWMKGNYRRAARAVLDALREAGALR